MVGEVEARHVESRKEVVRVVLAVDPSLPLVVDVEGVIPRRLGVEDRRAPGFTVWRGSDVVGRDVEPICWEWRFFRGQADVRAVGAVDELQS